jgi:signal transduction histidine kinase
MRATAGKGQGADGVQVAWWPFLLGGVIALATAAMAAAAIAPMPAALRKAEVAPGSVAWLLPIRGGTPVHWLEGGEAGDLRSLPRDGREIQVSILLADKPDAAGMLLFLPAAAVAPTISVNGAEAPRNAVVGAPYLAANRMRPVIVAIPAHFFRPGLNRLDAVFPGREGAVLMAPPFLGDPAEIAPIVARLSAWTGPMRSVALWACLAAAVAAMAAAVFARSRGWFLGLAAAALAFGCRILVADVALPPWMETHPAMVGHGLLAAALASLACAALNRPRMRPGLAMALVAGALGAWVMAASLVAVREAFEPYSGWWLPWLEAFHGCVLVGPVVVLAVASAWTFGRGAVRFVNLNLNLSRAVRLQRIRIEQTNRALQQQMRRAAIMEERQRLARDVHDGVGGMLASLLARIRMRRIDIGQIESELVGGLADLRLIVDSMDAAGSSLAAALAVFRSRIAPQAEASGMLLAWEQPESPGGDACDPAWMLNLYRLMQEAVYNALRHSGGRNLLVSVLPLDAHRLRIEIADDGIGLPAQPVSHGNGLANMAWRAQRLGAELRVDSPSGNASAGNGTRVVLDVALPTVDAAQPRGAIRPS